MTFPLSIQNIEDQTTSTHSITVLSVNLQIPLQQYGVLSGFKVRKPNIREINNIYSDSVTMTADSPEWYPMDSRYQGEEKEMRKDLNEDLNCNPRDRRIQLIQLHTNLNEQILPQVHFNADLWYCSISHKRKGTVSRDQLIQRWNIGIETAEHTYEATTLLDVRDFVETKGTKQLKHTSYQLKHRRLRADAYTDTMFADTKSLSQYTCAQILCTDFNWVAFYPMRHKADAHLALEQSIFDYVVFNTLIPDNVPELVSREFK